MAWMKVAAACGLLVSASVLATTAAALPPPQAATVNIVRAPDAPQTGAAEHLFEAMAYGGPYGGAFNVTQAPADAALTRCATETDGDRRLACIRALPRQAVTVLVFRGSAGSTMMQCIGTGVGPSEAARQTISLEHLSWPPPRGADTDGFRADRQEAVSCLSAAQNEQQAAGSTATAIAAVVRAFGALTEGSEVVSWATLERHTPSVVWGRPAARADAYIHRRTGRLGEVTVTACGTERSVIWLNLRQPDSGNTYADGQAVRAAFDQTGAERTLEMIEGAEYDNRDRIQYPGGRVLRVYAPRGVGGAAGANTTVTYATAGYTIPIGIPRDWQGCLGVISEVG